jgi:hypothetical protein
MNPDEEVQKRIKQFKKIASKISRNNNGRGTNQYIKAKEMGLPKPKISKETKQKFMEHAKKHNGTFWTKENRQRQRNIMVDVVKNNPDLFIRNKTGWVKNYKYKNVMLKGKWELKTAKWLDKQNIKWEYEKYNFLYEWEGNEHRYFPDFYLKNLDVFIEVKGYKTDKDLAKWKQFTKKLIIFDEKYINKLNMITIYDIL